MIADDLIAHSNLHAAFLEVAKKILTDAELNTTINSAIVTGANHTIAVKDAIIKKLSESVPPTPPAPEITNVPDTAVPGI